MIGVVTEKFKVSGSYEFLYEIPAYDVDTKYNRWKQDLFPSDQPQKEGKNVSGFEPIHLSFDRVDPRITSEVIPFNGLAVSNNVKNALYDGTSSNGQWFFAVGVFRDSVSQSNAIPGYGWDKEVILWIRIPPHLCSARVRYKAPFNILIILAIDVS